MLSYVLKRLGYMIAMLLVVSVVSFILIQLPPGDYMTTYMSQLEQTGEKVNIEQVEALRAQYGLDKPMWQQYTRWMGNMLKGDFGYSFQYKTPVSEVIGDRITITIIISVVGMLLTYLVAVALGVFASIRQYSFWDYLLSIFAFIGMSVPNFILALLLIYASFKMTGSSMMGLFSPEFTDAPWSVARVLDMCRHLPIPIFLTVVGGVASLFRVTRACMLDELDKIYVTAARARGVSEKRLLLKYPTRIALNPVVSSASWVLPNLVSGSSIVAIVLSLPMVAPVMLSALKTQDMYLAGTLVLFLSMLTIVGTFLSDMLLIAVDPRIRLKG